MRVSRRGLLIGGGAGIGLIVGWALWPRGYHPNLAAGPGESVMNAFVKIGTDGRVVVVVPQVEMGQGVYTTLPQIVADELGADWRQVGVEPAPINPLYANTLFFDELADDDWRPRWWIDQSARRDAVMVTGGSTSVRGFEARLREAGAGARALLCRAAAARWDADWRACTTANGFVTRGDDRLRFGELAAAASTQTLPTHIALRSGSADRLTGQSLPRLDLPSKVDGTVTYAADVRLPDMVYAAITQGPRGATALTRVDRDAALRVPGVLEVVTTDRWAAVAATNGWAAQRGVDALGAQFAVDRAATAQSVDAALDQAFAAGSRIAEAGNVGEVFEGKHVLTAEYRIGFAPHATIETPSATARLDNGHFSLWIGTQVPHEAARRVAAAIGIAPGDVVVHPVTIGGSFGSRYETEIAGQVAILAQRMGRPVQLTWSRGEDLRQDRYRPAAAARMTAHVLPDGRIDGWLAKIAAPATTREWRARVFDRTGTVEALDEQSKRDSLAVAGAVPPYAIANYAVDHHPAAIGVPTGDWRGRGYALTAFFTECFVDELAAAGGSDPFSFRIAMLGQNPRLAECLTRVTALGGWQGGVAGSGQGIACTSMTGSHIAVLAEAQRRNDGGVRVTRLVAVVDCGRVINPDIVRQQIGGGLIFGASAATGAPLIDGNGRVGLERLGAFGLPRMADAPRITIELVASSRDPGGVGELAVPPVAPAIAGAIYAATGQRVRQLPVVAA